jgi:alpha-tubulin suppressor-like RCC1 family protein
LSEDGKLFVFGHNKDGKLGLMNKEKKYITPTQIDPKHFKVHTNYEIRNKVNAHL